MQRSELRDLPEPGGKEKRSTTNFRHAGGKEERTTPMHLVFGSPPGTAAAGRALVGVWREQR